jgi:peptidoglycan hydrolase CwlO-like protein
MKNLTSQIKLWTISITVLIVLAASSTAVKAQAIDIVATSQPTQSACAESKEAALKCLDKTLDAYEKAQAAIKAQSETITAFKDLDKTRQAQIEARDELITFYQKSLKKSKWQKAFERIEKYGTLAAGIWIGSKL